MTGPPGDSVEREGAGAEGGEGRMPGSGLVDLAGRFNRAITGGAGLRESDGSPVPQSDAVVRHNLTNLLIGVGLIVLLAIALHGLDTLAVIFALVLFVMLHEGGHFVTAKRSGMKVTEYFVGFGPRLWSFKRGETEYGVKAIPAGGYVRIVGMNNLDPVDPADEARSYRQQSFPKRFVVASAGSTVHFLIALIFLFVLNTVVGVTNPNKPTMKIDALEALTNGPSPAQQAGFRPGDIIVRADGQSLPSFDQLKTVIKQRPGQSTTFDVLRGRQRLTLTATPVDLSKVTPKDAVTGLVDQAPPPTTPTGFLGIAPVLAKDYAGPVTAAGRSLVQFGREVRLTFQGLGSLFSFHGLSNYGRQLFGNANAVKPSDAIDRPVSVVGIVKVSNQAAKAGLEPFLTVLVAINVIIGLINLTPLPPFDGGLVAVAVYERLRSRRGRRYRVDMNRLLPVAYAVVLVLMFLFVSSLYLDITRPL